MGAGVRLDIGPFFVSEGTRWSGGSSDEEHPPCRLAILLILILATEKAKG